MKLDDSEKTSQFRANPILKVHLPYPWLSPLVAIILVGAFFLSSQQEFLNYYQIPSITLSPLALTLVLAAALIFLIIDVRRFIANKKELQQKIEYLEAEVNDIWKSKKQLQEKAHIYSGHTDKLKRFISDKLLEYIEYDEKFLHFKSIAAEIRHNGVISYDIIKTALEDAAQNENSTTTEPKNLTDTHRFGLSNNPNSNQKQALEAMKYLWDLLDLSTTDNISLHIGNQLIECEEVYYQLELAKSKNSDSSPFILDKPYFSPLFATIKTLGPLLEPELLNKIINQTEKNIDSENTEHSFYENEHFRIHLNKTENLLGNENHLILLLENIIKNAQFFSTKNKYKQKSDKIGFCLEQGEHYIQYKIYNRGPNIKTNNIDQIFQLGHSTRKVKEHHGKGLGLFFVKEIVNGYQGRISVNNIQNQQQTITTIVTLTDNAIIKKTIALTIDKKRPYLQEVGVTDKKNQLQWSFDCPVESIEIDSSENKQSYLFNNFYTDDTTTIANPEQPFTPEWVVEVTPKKKQWLVKITALDISGVEFIIMLPSAEARLRGDEPDFNDNFDLEVEQLNKSFREFDDF